jgi:hypothetical protein
MKHGRITNIPRDPKSILDDALKVSFDHWVDEKGTKSNPSVFRREKSNLTIQEAFDLIFPNRPHWVILYRDVEDITDGFEKNYWEFGGSNLGESNYGTVFIWIKVSPEEAQKIFDKYNLKIEWY